MTTALPHMRHVNTFLLAPPEQLTPQAARLRRAIALALQLAAIVLAAWSFFRAGALWNLRVFAQSQAFGRPGQDPFLASFARYAITVLWAVPGSIGLFVSARGFEGGKRWWWIVLLGTLAWFGAYFLIAPPQIYYYWLRPAQ
ncbi:MAG TPA: hypothetical protein VNJ06_08965 [Gemmatimonadales bacterium]|nr:hypothetical protein [Gemmatimonadales bacterium]